jgi:nucleotide-binding universal stress UspA family protein
MAASLEAELVLLHVLPPLDEMRRSGQPTGGNSVAMQELRQLAAETSAGCCLEIEPIVVHGNPSIEILAVASERPTSLIILGATQRSAFANLTRDRTIYQVLAHARCPVLTIRETLDASAEASAESLAAFQG